MTEHTTQPILQRQRCRVVRDRSALPLVRRIRRIRRRATTGAEGYRSQQCCAGTCETPGRKNAYGRASDPESMFVRQCPTSVPWLEQPTRLPLLSVSQMLKYAVESESV